MLGRKAQHKDSQTLIKLKMEREELEALLLEGTIAYGKLEKEEIARPEGTFEGIIETEKDRERAFILEDKARREQIVYKIIRTVELSKGLHAKTMKDYTTHLSSPYTKKNYTDLMQHLGSNIPMMTNVQIVEFAEFLSSDDACENIQIAYTTAIAKSPKSV